MKKGGCNASVVQRRKALVARIQRAKCKPSKALATEGATEPHSSRKARSPEKAK